MLVLTLGDEHFRENPTQMSDRDVSILGITTHKHVGVHFSTPFVILVAIMVLVLVSMWLPGEP